MFSSARLIHPDQREIRDLLVQPDLKYSSPALNVADDQCIFHLFLL